VEFLIINITEKLPKYDKHGLLVFDDFDRKILAILGTGGRLSMTDLAKQIGLSNSRTQTRLKRLETEGFILGYRALLDPIRLGLDHVAFV
jgi:Lrp/AsnC family transcriptional regulator, leucine-responsive regulatory protein